MILGRSSTERSVRGGRWVLLASVALVAGCASSTELMSTWAEPNYSGGTTSSVLVVALRDDAVKRRLWEDGFVSSLAERGVKATPSYALFPMALPDTQQVVDAIRKNGFDGVLSLMRLADQTRTVTTAGYTRREPYTIKDWAGRFHTYYRDVYEPGTSTTESILTFQSDLWRIGADPQLVWSALVRVNESVSGNFIRDAIRSGFIPDLTKKGMVPAKAGKR